MPATLSNDVAGKSMMLAVTKGPGTVLSQG